MVDGCDPSTDITVFFKRNMLHLRSSYHILSLNQRILHQETYLKPTPTVKWMAMAGTGVWAE